MHINTGETVVTHPCHYACELHNCLSVDLLVLTNAWLAMRYCRWALQYCGGSEKWSHWWVPCSDGALLPTRQSATAGAKQPPYVSVCVFCSMSCGSYIICKMSQRFEIESLHICRPHRTDAMQLGQLYILMLYLLVHNNSCCFQDSQDSCSGILSYDHV
jgi:hypothetical protein